MMTSTWQCTELDCNLFNPFVGKKKKILVLCLLLLEGLTLLMLLFLSWTSNSFLRADCCSSSYIDILVNQKSPGKKGHYYFFIRLQKKYVFSTYMGQAKLCML